MHGACETDHCNVGGVSHEPDDGLHALRNIAALVAHEHEHDELIVIKLVVPRWQPNVLQLLLDDADELAARAKRAVLQISDQPPRPRACRPEWPDDNFCDNHLR